MPLLSRRGSATLAKYYKPVSVLPGISKVFEGIIQKQLSEYIEKFLSPLLSGYRKGFNIQTALLGLVEKWKASFDKKEFAGDILMDLSKAVVTMSYS